MQECILSDNIVGYIVGAGIGICVPELHKRKIMQNVYVVPVINTWWKGIGVYYNIR